MQLAFKQQLARRLAGIDVSEALVDDLDEVLDGYFARVFDKIKKEGLY